MTVLHYKIEFYSEWHCGSGLSAGADLDALVIRDRNGLPYIPGKTLKGLLRDAAETLRDLGHVAPEVVETVFGRRTEDGAGGSSPGRCHFTDARLSRRLQKKLLQPENGAGADAVVFLFRSHSSTAVDENGQAKEHTLRRTETVIPLTLFASVLDVPDEEAKALLEKCLGFVKRLGVNRNRGLGRCDMSLYEEGDSHD